MSTTSPSCPYCGAAPLPAKAKVCPACQTELAGEGESPETHLIAVEAIRQELAARTPTAKERSPAAATEGSPNQAAGLAEQRWRPLSRPPVAILRVVDDQGDLGEEFRLRESRTVVGRTEGDVLIPHDTAISSRHMEIVREESAGGFRWYVADLGSTNGTFACVTQALLHDGQELQLGACRFRFEMGQVSPAPPLPVHGATSAWQSPAAAGARERPALVVLGGPENGRLPLKSDDTLVGRDAASCDLVLPADDSFAAPQHARLWRDRRGRWAICPVNTRNGVWVRIKRIEVVSLGHFLIGEQRLSLKVPRHEAAT